MNLIRELWKYEKYFIYGDEISKWTKEQIEICSNNFKCFLATDEDGWLSQNVQVKNNLIYKRFSFSYLIELNKFIRNNEIYKRK